MRAVQFALLLAGCSTLALGPAPAAANPVKSLYTTIELKTCRQIKRHSNGGAWLCEGLGGLPIYVAQGASRQFVSVGEDAQARRAATQTLRPSNTIFERGKDRATVEWRFVRRGERQIPYATIVRFHTFQDHRRGDVLVVSRVSPSETCHVAYIDALANQDAITLARFIADNEARGFDCRNDPHAEGATGRSPM